MPLCECVAKVDKIKWSNFNNIKLKYIDLSSVSRENHLIINTTYINEEDAPSRAQQIVRENDVLFGTTRPMLKRVSIITSEYDNQICSTGFCVLRADVKKILPKWIYYNIETTRFYDFVNTHQEGTSYPSISDSCVKSFEIPVPSLKEQQRIVDILDRFDKLCNDISEGLPAEIEARKKQYEYYRDKLLSFKKKN